MSSAGLSLSYSTGADDPPHIWVRYRQAKWPTHAVPPTPNLKTDLLSIRAAALKSTARLLLNLLD